MVARLSFSRFDDVDGNALARERERLRDIDAAELGRQIGRLVGGEPAGPSARGQAYRRPLKSHSSVLVPSVAHLNAQRRGWHVLVEGKAVERGQRARRKIGVFDPRLDRQPLPQRGGARSLELDALGVGAGDRAHIAQQLIAERYHGFIR